MESKTLYRGFFGLVFMASFLAAGCGSDSSNSPAPNNTAPTCTIEDACADRECGVEPECDFDCGTCADDEQCSAAGMCEVTSSEPPTFSFVGLDRERIAEGTFDVEWIDDDPDSNAQISLYFDDDSEGADGTLIVSGISEDDDADLHPWNLAGLSTGSYWLYAVIEDGVNVETVYAESAIRVVSFECVEPVMGKFAVDIETVDFELEVTLDGQPIDSTNTSLASHGVLYLNRTSLDGDFAGYYSFFEEGNPVSTFDVSLPAGVYDIAYQPRGRSSSWPITSGVVARGVEIFDGGSFALDIQTIGVTLDWTINSETYTGSATETATLTFLDGERGYAGSASIDTTQTDPQTLRVLPGVFDTFYRPPSGLTDTTSTALPVNWGPLGEFDFTEDTAATVDIPAVDQPIDATLNGVAWSTTLSGGTSDAGQFLLVREGVEDCTTFCPPPDMITVVDASGPVLPATYTIFPGDFLVAFDSFRTLHPELPISGLIDDSVTFDGTAQMFGISTKAITLDLSINSTPIDELALGPTTVRLSSYPDRGFGPEAVVSSETAEFRVFEAGYDVRLIHDRDLGASEDGWPETGGGRSIGTIDASNANAFTIDIETANLTVDPRLAGNPISSANLTAADLPRIFMRVPEEAGSFYELVNLFDVLPETTWTRPYLMGPVELSYVNAFRNQGVWPTSFFHTLQNIDLVADQTVELDIEGTPVEFVVSINGTLVDSAGPVPPISLGREPFNESFEVHEDGSVGDWAPLEPQVFPGDYWVTIDTEFLGNPAFDARPAVACIRVPEP